MNGANVATVCPHCAHWNLTLRPLNSYPFRAVWTRSIFYEFGLGGLSAMWSIRLGAVLLVMLVGLGALDDSGNNGPIDAVAWLMEQI